MIEVFITDETQKRMVKFEEACKLYNKDAGEYSENLKKYADAVKEATKAIEEMIVALDHLPWYARILLWIKNE